MEPELIDAPHARERSRLACVFSLTGDPVPEKHLKGLERQHVHLELGRFEKHFDGDGAGDAAWPLHKARSFSDAALATSRGAFLSGASGAVYVAFVPRSGTVLLLVFDFDADLTASVNILQETCFRWKELTIGDRLLLDGFADGLPPKVAGSLASVSPGSDVHQLFMVGTRLAAELPAKDEHGDRIYDAGGFMRLVYREDRRFRTVRGYVGMRRPSELNRPCNSLCAHGRGVTVLVGAAEHVESGVTICAVELVAALERMRRIRSEGKAALEVAESVKATKKQAQARAMLGELAQDLGDLEVELSFGVAQYLDALRFPEIVLQSYRESLSETLGIATGAERTGEMLGRLKNVLAARREELAAVESRDAAIRRRRTTLAAGYVAIVAVPLSALLAFLGANGSQVKGEYSFFALRHYWPYYAGLLGIVLGGAAIFGLFGWFLGWCDRRKDASLRRKARAALQERDRGGP
jgi:hypothetical protein